MRELEILNKCKQEFEFARRDINKGIHTNQMNLLKELTNLIEIMKKLDSELAYRLQCTKDNLIANFNMYNVFEFGALREQLKYCEKIIQTNSIKEEIAELIDRNICEKTPYYIKKTIEEINMCYQNKTYIACAVMLRRLIESLIIESFEIKGDVTEIQENDDFCKLNKLIDVFIKAKLWNYSRNTRKMLEKLKGLGDISAHNRKFITQKSDIDKLYDDIRVCLDDFIQTIY